MLFIKGQTSSCLALSLLQGYQLQTFKNIIHFSDNKKHKKQFNVAKLREEDKLKKQLQKLKKKKNKVKKDESFVSKSIKQEKGKFLYLL